MYEITDYTRKKATHAGLTVKVSSRKHKKIDVFLNGQYLDSVGDSRYMDYPHYIQSRGKEYADERRRLYHLRHTKDTLGEQLSRYLLW